MSKDNFISAVFGVLLGFIAGYLMHEVMVGRQPPRLPPGMSTTATAPGEQAGGAPAEQPAAPMVGQVRELEARLAKDPKDVEALQGLAAMYFQINDKKKSADYLARYVELRPDDLDAVRQLADLRFDGQDWEQARDLYTRYLGQHPGDPDVMTDLGVTYRSLKQFDRALELFDKASKTAPDHWRSRYNQVVVLAFDLNRIDAARQVLAELQRMQPNNQQVSELAAAVEKRKSA